MPLTEDTHYEEILAFPIGYPIIRFVKLVTLHSAPSGEGIMY